MQYRLIFIFLLFSLSNSTKIFAQNWQWADVFVGTFKTKSITANKDGNVYNLVESLVDAKHGVDSFGGTANSIILTKHDSLGNLVWLRSSINGIAFPNSMCLDGEGNILILGYYRSDSITFNSTTLFNSRASTFSNSPQNFVAKYNSLGNLIFAKNLYNFKQTNPQTNICAGFSNFYVNTLFTDTFLTLNGGTLVNRDSTGIATDILLAKYDSLGNLIWYKNIGGIQAESEAQIAVSQAEHIYLYGTSYSDTLHLDNFSIPNPNLNVSQFQFLAKFDSSGNLIRATKLNQLSAQFIQINECIKTDLNENIVLFADYDTTIHFGSFNLIYDSSKIGHSIFLAKFDSSFQVLWAKSIADTMETENLDLDNCGNIWISCKMEVSNSYNILLGGHYMQPLSPHTLFPAIYAGFDNNGILINAFFSQTAKSNLNGIACGNGGDIFISTEYSGPQDTVGNTTLPPTNNSYPILGANFYVAKFNSNYCNTSAINTITATKKGISIFPNPTNNFVYLSGIEENVNFIILDLFGRIIFKKNLNRDDNFIDLNFLKAGIFIAQISYKDGSTETQKIIKL